MSTEPKPKTQITDPIGRNVAANVRRIREALGWSTYQVSGKLRDVGRPISPSAVAKVERAERRVDVGDLVALAAVFNVNPSALLLPRDDGDTVVQVVPAENHDVVASRAWNWVDGRERLYGHPDQEQDIESFLEFIRLSRPPRRGREEMAHWLQALHREDDRGGADGASVD
ncbi:helix-turn-helix domain-containing protein [Streptomyces gossypiisoli]|uniref:helix-turn-helix domain-containing protein n=1 Tax=Streptomyces gossypiisoli TaxID=2748864 RepID=UPI0015DBA845|nr:helix-turn-helix domain-containing protein [Streptomyces gossypiisoli]